jgi:hypothetical protein
MQSFEAISLVEQTPSPTQQNGEHPQIELIQQIPFEQGAHEGQTAMHANILPRLLLQVRDCLGNISREDCGGLPLLDVAQSGGHHVLGDRVNEASKGEFGGRGGPKAAQA